MFFIVQCSIEFQRVWKMKYCKMPIVRPNETSPRTCKFFCNPKNGKLCRPFSGHLCYINRLYIQTIYSAGLHQCPIFMDQKLLKMQKTVVSPKYFFHGLDHGILITTVQWLQLNFLLLNTQGGIYKEKKLFSNVFLGFCNTIWSQLWKAEIKYGSKL